MAEMIPSEPARVMPGRKRLIRLAG